jgi:hypothetical protein
MKKNKIYKGTNGRSYIKIPAKSSDKMNCIGCCFNIESINYKACARRIINVRICREEHKIFRELDVTDMIKDMLKEVK